MEFMREYYTTMIFYDFKGKLNQEEGFQRPQLAYKNESLSHDTVLSYDKLNSLLNKNALELSGAAHENVSAIR